MGGWIFSGWNPVGKVSQDRLIFAPFCGMILI